MKKETNTLKTTNAKVVNLGAGLNTIRVEVERVMMHPKYGKAIKKHKDLLVHVKEEDKSALTVGAQVNIVEVKPISKLKKWILAK